MLVQIKPGVKLTHDALSDLWLVQVEGPCGWIVQGEWRTYREALEDYKKTESYVTEEVNHA